MEKRKLGKLVEIKDLREIWPDEAKDFTPWLAKEENIEILSDTLDLDIAVESTESSVGSFSVDIFATDMGTERKIIIENQLEDTNHDHLGKLITYASGKGADIIIWLVKHAREEHRAAIEWLNNHTDDQIGFFLCEIKVVQIGDSNPAVKFEIVEKPNDWVKEVRKTENVNETQQQRYDYWAAFQEYAFKNSDFSKEFKRRKANTDHWMNFAIGSSTYTLSISQLQKRNELGVELNITEDKELFNELLKNKGVIESETGMNFSWREMPERKSSRIVAWRKSNLKDKAKWTEQFDWLIDSMLKMKKVFLKYINS